MSFGGSTLTGCDAPRLETQLEAVRTIMQDAQPRTLAELAAEVEHLTGKRATEASVSARLRDLRKEKFGGLKVLRSNLGNGLFSYQVV